MKDEISIASHIFLKKLKFRKLILYVAILIRKYVFSKVCQSTSILYHCILK